ncbi:MAG: hypothetical protein KDA36_12535, partial [Planctomycetaceae bacterium]|nr:hypothetical protein [Planctomycetaceae bacterium]
MPADELILRCSFQKLIGSGVTWCMELLGAWSCFGLESPKSMKNAFGLPSEFHQGRVFVRGRDSGVSPRCCWHLLPQQRIIGRSLSVICFHRLFRLPSLFAETLRSMSEELVRLSKLMSERGICSRREADEFIQRGWVIVDGNPIRELGTKVRRDQHVE